MSGKTRPANQARLVRCAAGCGALVWLAGALPTTADDEFVCPTCARRCPTEDAAGGARCVRPDHTDEFHVFAGTSDAADYLAGRAEAPA